ncbi:secreted protein [methanotrophic bacterial endosymbiont of Bathymodiolus sp.]|jgi:hypothetical protein|nr:secreted protein [methanotrophic bacterial endosymbiont of Bathymodiolus sp.]
MGSFKIVISCQGMASSAALLAEISKVDGTLVYRNLLISIHYIARLLISTVGRYVVNIKKRQSPCGF